VHVVRPTLHAPGVDAGLVDEMEWAGVLAAVGD